MIKRTLDFLIALMAIPFLTPLFFFTALLVRIDSSGPIIFKQKRVGRKGKLFTIYKFRTMVDDAQSMGPAITAQNDPRITQIGNILRWLKLDEFPQVFNVLKGDMSFVGPRPEIPEIVEKYSQEEKGVLEVRPGIIGPSQIQNRDESSMLHEKENVEDFYQKHILPEKLKTDLAYAKKESLIQDILLLFGGMGRLFLTSIKWRYIFESRRRLMFLISDLVVSVFSFWAAFALRFELLIPDQEWSAFLRIIPFIIILRAPCFVYFGLYQTLWQYLGIQELLAIIKAVSVGSLLIPFIPFFMQMDFFPRSVLIIDWLLLMVILGGSRVVFKLTVEKLKRPRFDHRKNVLIVGAEDMGELLVREFIKKPTLGYRPIGFLDDDSEKVGVRIHGVKVMGKVSQLAQVVRLKKADEVIIALPQTSGKQIQKIIKDCRRLNLTCQTLPQETFLMPSQSIPSRLRPVDISDLLGRELIQADLSGIQDFFRDKRILITGAGGSIGSELVRILFQNHPEELIVVDSSENNLYDVETDLNEKPSQTNVVSYLRDVTHREEMEKIFKRHKPQIVYHAAAFKHVPMMEANVSKAVLNNIGGTKVMADLARAYQTDYFIMISTDKAIRPKSVMGVTKRISELYAQSLKGKKTRFLAVRFGNVFNSKGSVVPLFKKQIENGGPITITSPDVTRYFMDLSEAVFLVLEATRLGTDSEIFVLDMGKPVRIIDLAKNLVQLAGLPPENFPIRYTGLRPGEKMQEDLELSSEEAVPTSNKKIKIWRSSNNQPTAIEKEVAELMELARKGASREEMIDKIKAIVREYKPELN